MEKILNISDTTLVEEDGETYLLLKLEQQNTFAKSLPTYSKKNILGFQIKQGDDKILSEITTTEEE